MQGTVTEVHSTSRVHINIDVSFLETGTYCVSCDNILFSLLFIVKKSDETLQYVNKTYTVDGTEQSLQLRIILGETAQEVGTVIDETGKVMLNIGDTPIPWEPYTGGIPSPNPEYPQELISVGNKGNIIINITDSIDNLQSISISTLNGLPGIPVDSGGNYTDENGQQWVCDEIDFERGGVCTENIK